MDGSVISQLWNELYTCEGEKLVSYGKTMQTTKQQLEVLVALNYVFPSNLTCAIELIEQGKCTVYTYNKRRTYAVEGYILTPNLWACPCSYFTRQVMDEEDQCSVDKHSQEEVQWFRACRHLLAVYIVEKRFPIMSYETVNEEPISVSAIAKLSLELH